MKNNYNAKRFGILLLIMLICILPVGLIAHAEDSTYEMLEVKIPYKHIYTTTDVNADSVFHYSISAEDDAPLPVEADENGVFSFNGVSGSGIKDENKSIFNLDGNLTFKFTKPGIYYYKIKADSETDGKKKNFSYYTLNPETITIALYVNALDDNKMNLKMMTAQSSDNVKLDEIVFEAKYTKTETSSSPSSNPDSSVPSRPSTVNSTVTNSESTSQSLFERTFKTGDESNKLFYIILMTLSAVIMFAILNLSYEEAEDSEKNTK